MLQQIQEQVFQQQRVQKRLGHLTLDSFFLEKILYNYGKSG